MPIKIPDKLPAAKTLKDERIFVMTEKRASSQDIRPLKIAILNIMPTKIVTETQLLRLLGNSPIQVDVDLLKTKTYESKNTAREHLAAFYKVFDDIKDQKYDGLIITGAPVEIMDFDDVEYWQELCDIITRYDHKMSEGLSYLRLYKLYMREKEYYLSKLLCRKEYDLLKESVVKEIFGK